MKFDSVIFDLDGTLWDSAEGVSAAWNSVLKRYPELNARTTPESIHGVMGLTMDDITRRLLGTLPDEDAKRVMAECMEEENRYLAKNGGRLFPHVRETLAVLKNAGLRLFIVSNCQLGYIESFLEAHRLGEYFEDFECWGRTLAEKGVSNRILMERRRLTSPVYVGDTATDLKSARDAGIPFVWARYGFGEAAQYDYVIDDFDKLPEVLTKA